MYWSPFTGEVALLGTVLRIALVADVAPQLVAFDPVHAKADHHTVVQFGATATDSQARGADGLAVDAGDTRDGADGRGLHKGGNDFNLLVAGKDVHGLDPWLRIGPKPDSGKTARNPLYSPEWSLLRGSIPGL